MAETTGPQIVLFEDSFARSKRFLPLTYTRTVAELRCGFFTSVERTEHAFPRRKIFVHSTPELLPVMAGRQKMEIARIEQDVPILFLNARSFFSSEHIKQLEQLPLGSAMAGQNSELVALHILPSRSTLEQLRRGQALDTTLFQFENRVTINAKTFRSLWEMVHYNNFAIKSDIQILRTSSDFEKMDAFRLKDVKIARMEYVNIHPTAKIGLGVVLDATEGPIYIDRGVQIMPQATIIGPVTIGKNSLVKVGAKIYQGTTVGPHSKVGGEIENSIIQGYSNKQHDGYLGHSFIGEWVNLGADTNTSDLKNDYSPVRLTIEDETIDTTLLFVGLLMGDHSKSAINTQFNTGTVVGVSCNIYDSGFPPKWVPSFSWGGASGFVEYKIDKAIRVARTVIARRNIELSEPEERLLRTLAKRTSV